MKILARCYICEIQDCDNCKYVNNQFDEQQEEDRQSMEDEQDRSEYF